MVGRRTPAFWKAGGLISTALQPLAYGFRGLAALRRLGYGYGLLPVRWLSVPVVVVGNVTVGGAGKTPLVIWLVERARALGYQPGVILRGYGGRLAGPMAVSGTTDPAAVGDEAVLIAQRTGAPVTIARDRPAAGQALLEHEAVDLIISDDGLQHYALGRHAEVLVIDAARGLGNRRCLPAGPLREPPTRLMRVDAVIGNGGEVDHGEGHFVLTPLALAPVGIAKPQRSPPGAGAQVHGIAGIGDPVRFFASLEALGYEVEQHAFGDHHRYRSSDITFDDEKPVIMTEKDAVKCRELASEDVWYLPVQAAPSPGGVRALDRVIEQAAARHAHGKKHQ